MYVRIDKRGYCYLVKSQRLSSSTPRQSNLGYLGRKDRIKYWRICSIAEKQSIEREEIVEAIVKKRLMINNCNLQAEIILLKDDEESPWKTELRTSNVPLQEKQRLEVSASELSEIARALRSAARDLCKCPYGQNRCSIRILIHVEYPFPLGGCHELRLSLGLLSTPPLELKLPPCEPYVPPMILKMGSRYVKKQHGVSISPEAIYKAIERGRLGCSLGGYGNGVMKAMLLPDKLDPSKPFPAKWGSIGVHREDLDHLVEERGLWTKSVEALIRRRLESADAD